MGFFQGPRHAALVSHPGSDSNRLLVWVLEAQVGNPKKAECANKQSPGHPWGKFTLDS